MNITVAGTGYVGLSMSVLLSVRHNVKALDVVQSKVDMINSKISPIEDTYITKFLNEKDLHLTATTDKEFAYTGAELVIVATPTNYNEETHYFDTSSIDDVVENVKKYCPDAIIMVKSTVPVGFIESMRKKHSFDNIYFSPEFLREGRALYDNLYPSRIVVGDTGEVGKMFSNLLVEAAAADKDSISVVLMGPTEAEAVKLFANSYLATRVAYFNELDSYAVANGLDSASIILGVSLDPRIGNSYNNPSFGYGGYCFPKDTKQLKSNFEIAGVGGSVVSAVVDSNTERKKFIANDVMTKYPNGKIGIFKTAMKAGSDNNRSSAIIDIIKLLLEAGRTVIVYDPANNLKSLGCEQVDTVEELISECSVIMANRVESELVEVRDKVYTRDAFGRD